MQVNQTDLELSYLIHKIRLYVLDYCNLEETNSFLDMFIEDKASSIFSLYKEFMESKTNAENNIGQINNNLEVKAITRGDTKIEYNVATPISQKENKEFDLPTLLEFTDKEKKILNRHRKLKK